MEGVEHKILWNRSLRRQPTQGQGCQVITLENHYSAAFSHSGPQGTPSYHTLTISLSPPCSLSPPWFNHPPLHLSPPPPPPPPPLLVHHAPLYNSSLNLSSPGLVFRADGGIKDVTISLSICVCFLSPIPTGSMKSFPDKDLNPR